jgi:hypothetical protein
MHAYLRNRAKILSPFTLRDIVYDIPKGPTLLRAKTNLESFVRVPGGRDGTMKRPDLVWLRAAGGREIHAAQPPILAAAERARKAAFS